MSAEFKLGKPIQLPGEPCPPITELLQVDAPKNKPVRERLLADFKAIKEAQRAALRIK